MTNQERRARALHEAYEKAAKEEGWKTQESCRVDFDDLPEANRRTMLKAVDAIEQSDAESGMVTVPRKPTEAMKAAAVNTHPPTREDNRPIWHKLWSNMLQAHENSKQESDDES
jgi:hypothetical protein